MESSMHKKKLTKRERLDEIYAYLFIFPLFFVFVVFIAVPFFMSFYISLTDYNMALDMQFIGFGNYEYIFWNFTSNYFVKSFMNVALYALMYLPIVLVSGVLVAVLVNARIRGTYVFKILFYLPCITSSIAVGYIWNWIFNPSLGPINTILGKLGLWQPQWLSDPNLALFCIVLVTSWGALGGNVLIFSAALKGVPPDYYEAATIDGAGSVRQFLSITVPLISPTIYFVFITSLISTFQLFDQVLVLTNGGPAGATMTPVLFIYWNAFVEFEGGIASAMSVILFLVIMVITVITQRFVKEDKSV